ncbi:glycerol-3-phosphate acyltransferase 1, mitochondrial-like isoform X2 [Centruroides sculpturatus]|uniref:glycerol-3-phosphate acyltransferase 1, mitochondrial-like isoform X2 n=1 Tax=Centruroides sculpturatus TaxID=218467 RepID=UPI000C6DB898|nr:glycerol-3-phosphate acyltransferase 1, mitochondrial-like isoform X2 [Centruroides sculpturatus]
MIAALLVCVSVYLAVRVALIEIAQYFKQVCIIWRGKATETLTIGTTANRRISTQTSDENKIVQSSSVRSRRKGIISNSSFSSSTDSTTKPAKTVRWKDTQPGMSPSNPMDSLPKNNLKNGYNNIINFTNRFSNDTLPSSASVNMLFTPENNNRSFLARTYHYAKYILNRKSNYVYADVSKNVLECPRVKDAINQATIEEMSENDLDHEEMEPIHQKHQHRAVELLDRMKSCMSSILLKIASWVMFKLLSRMFNGLNVNKRQIENLKRFNQQNIPIVYIPLHRSHLDYILVTYVLYMNDMRAPLVAAGDNLFIPFFGMLMKGLGAFFIKRKLDAQKGRKDHVYRAVLQTYMLENLRSGHSLEFFIEGGRSRSGKSCMPKAGLLSVVVDSVLEGITTDAYIVPVAISYEKIVDGNFVSEQLGRPKVMESFTSAVKAIWRTLHSKFGKAHIEFCEPFSLKEFLQSAENLPPLKAYQYSGGRRNSVQTTIREVSRRTSVYGTDIVIEDQRQTIKNLAEQIVYDASNSAVIMSTNLLAFLLLTKHRKGATLQQLSHSMMWLREEIAKRNRTVGFCEDSCEAIKHSYTLLGKQLLTSEIIQMEWSSNTAENNNVKIIFYKPVVQLPHILELQYYANSVISAFLLDSVIVNALSSILEEKKANQSESKLIPRYQLINRALMLCDILQYEFIFTPPGTKIPDALNTALDNLISDNVLMVSLEREYPVRKLSQSSTSNLDFSDDSSDEEQEFEFNQKIKLHKNDDQHKFQFFYCILAPYIEAYWLAASSLKALVGCELAESAVLQEMWKTANDYLPRGLLLYEESFAADPLRNSIKLFEQWRIVETIVKDSSNYIRVCNVNGVQSAIERIETFRK